MSKRLMTIDECLHFYQQISINYNAQQLQFYSSNQMVVEYGKAIGYDNITFCV